MEINYFSQIIDKDKREKYIEGNLYFKLYKSGYAVFKDYPIFGVGNKNYRVVTSNNVTEKVNENYFVALIHTSFILKYYLSMVYWDH